MYELLGFVTFWRVLYVNGLEIQLIFYHMFLILLPSSVMKSGIHSFLFFTAFMILVFLVKLAFLVTSTGLWHKLTKILTVLSQFSTSMKGARAKPKAVFMYNVQKQPILVFGCASLAQNLHIGC